MAGGRIAVSRRERVLGRTMPRHLSGRDMSSQALGGTIPQLGYDVGPWLYVLALLCMVALVAFLYLAQTTAVARQIEEMESLERQLRQLRWDNNALLLQIAQYQKMSRIKQEARDMGLAEAQDVEYVEVVLDQSEKSSDGDIAPHVPSSLPTTSSHSPAWLEHVMRQLRNWLSVDTVLAEQLDR